MSTSPVRPGLLALELTPQCNRRCVYCYNEIRDSDCIPNVSLNVDDWIDITERIMSVIGRTAIELTGGEPLLWPGVWDLMALLRARGLIVSLVTDGSVIGVDTAECLARLGVGPVQPTILAGTAEVHDRMKGVSGAFRQTIDAVARLKSAKVPVTVSFVCTSQNAEYFQDVLTLCFALGVKTVALSRFCCAGAGNRNAVDLTPSREQVTGCLDVAEDMCSRLPIKVKIAISLPLCVTDIRRYKHLKFGRCALGTSSPGYTVGYDGKLRACSISRESLGNLRTEPVESILARAQTTYFAHTRQLPDACSRCHLASLCGGGCRESAMQRFGGWNWPDPLAKP